MKFTAHIIYQNYSKHTNSTSKSQKSSERRARMNEPIFLLFKMRAKASTSLARGELVQSNLYIGKYIIFQKFHFLSKFYEIWFSIETSLLKAISKYKYIYKQHLYYIEICLKRLNYLQIQFQSK